ncbi:Glutamyl-Q tRNA(Asp) synthetase [Crenothrix polyspora]|uniref:Glutamyl-Q tRNA(Asp) synthetase n=1 Tax=Crenothrix polyspora TaxID=360316 RepID=A0A1R4H0J1_9GAMM|nr:tRNA glutamyl-Q(34) synthetase GluQRS [Crenothrix polyspora]SJM89722.1 Glutamyl-Q tRNA(Asp) synthetase [Crenothrix polyspora]
MSDKRPYIGRFAPSPTGSLHLGSLYTALASFLDAKAQQGLWLLRIDDLDTPRNAAGSVDSILKTLDALALQWDSSVYFQSDNLDVYHDVLAILQRDKRIYPCTCSRKTIAANLTENASIDVVYPNTCRNNRFPCSAPHALRIKTDGRVISFDDRLQGVVSHHLATQHGDFILKRKDHIIAYQFAVVIDDDRQGVNHVVRGMDLLDSTPKQIYVQQVLGLNTPNYLHVPIITDDKGFKLSKQTGAQSVELKTPTQVIFKLLDLLKQHPPAELYNAPTTELINWAIAHWDPSVLKNSRAIALKI